MINDNLDKNNQLDNIEFAHLMGMSDRLSNKLAKNYVTYKYLPYGHFKDTLPYLIRCMIREHYWKISIHKPSIKKLPVLTCILKYAKY